MNLIWPPWNTKIEHFKSEDSLADLIQYAFAWKRRAEITSKQITAYRRFAYELLKTLPENDHLVNEELFRKVDKAAKLSFETNSNCSKSFKFIFERIKKLNSDELEFVL